MFKIIIKKIKVMPFFVVAKYLVILLLLTGLIGDIFYSPSVDIKIHLSNFMIGGLILFVCWFKIKNNR
tara:strand:- start:94 stop:297 length:204 start_codon:yes stop_codon:yes gene_type:complete